MKPVPQIDQDRLSVLLGGVAVGFVLSKVIQLPSQQVGLMVLGSELGVRLSTHWLMMTFVIGLVIIGVRMLFSLHPLYRGGVVRRTAVYWILPALTALTIGILLARTTALPAWVLLMFGGIGLLQGVIAAEFRALDGDELERAQAQIATRILSHLLALTLFALVYATRARALLVAPAVVIVAFLLALRLLWYVRQEICKIALLAAAIGLVVGESVWALNYWAVSAVSGGLYLLLVFYVATGVAEQSLRGRLGGRVLLEYAVLALLAVVAIPSLHV